MPSPGCRLALTLIGAKWVNPSFSESLEARRFELPPHVPFACYLAQCTSREVQHERAGACTPLTLREAST
jgi:hypothetical protein